MIALRSAIVWLALAATTMAATLEQWVYVRLAAGETVTAVLSRDFAQIPLTVAGDVTSFTGPEGRYAIFVSGPGGTNQVLIAAIGEGQPTPPGPKPVDPVNPTPGPTPNPVDPTPPPDLADFPLEVWKHAVKVGDPDGAARIAANYAEVSRMKGDRDQLVAKLGDLNKALDLPKWNPFGVWVGKECNARGQTLPEIREVYAEIAKGLRAVK